VLLWVATSATRKRNGAEGGGRDGEEAWARLFPGCDGLFVGQFSTVRQVCRVCLAQDVSVGVALGLEQLG
jgi:hypothetical protein